MSGGHHTYVQARLLVELHGQPGWMAALTPLSVDGMIVAASTTLLGDSRSGRRAGSSHGRCWWRAVLRVWQPT